MQDLAPIPRNAFSLEPYDCGFPEHPQESQHESWIRQEQFLKAYAVMGKRLAACEDVGIKVSSMENWVTDNRWEFRKRYALAHEAYVEAWENGMDDRLQHPSGNRGSDILYMFKLKAEAPEKYRELSVLKDSPGKDLLTELKRRIRRHAPDGTVEETEETITIREGDDKRKLPQGGRDDTT